MSRGRSAGIYAPSAFVESDAARLCELMHRHAFALLVTAEADGPRATHVPLILDETRGTHGTLLGHVARANPHWRSFDGVARALCVFSGPHAYVSPRWYASERNVPTWDYVTVHASGAPRIIDDASRVLTLLRDMHATFERDAAGDAGSGHDFDAIPPDHVAALQRAIVAFEIPIEDIIGVRKLGQNKSPADRAGVSAGLRSTGDRDALEIAAMIDATLAPGGVETGVRESGRLDGGSVR